MVQQRIPLANFLDQIDTKTAKILLLTIATGVISNIKEGSLSPTDSQRLIFNLDVLLYCEKVKDKPLYNLIAHGMELVDIEQLVSDPNAVTNACINIERTINRILKKRQQLS
jgi:hypothetical protein